ncbi:MAG: hypothetical protein ACQEQA_02460 [Bacillota bacterium]
MDATTIVIIYTIGLASSLLITWLFTKISLAAAILPMTLYATAMVYFFVQPFINDYGINRGNFYLMGILFVLILIANALLVFYIKRDREFKARMKEKKKEYRKEIWE